MKKSDKTFKFELVTPDRVAVSGNVAMALMQGVQGEFGVLPDHSSLLAAIYPGVVTIVSNKGDYKRYFTSSGFADVSETLCSLLVETVQDLDEVSFEELDAELRSLRAKAKGHEMEAEELKELMCEIRYTETKIRAKKEKLQF